MKTFGALLIVGSIVTFIGYVTLSISAGYTYKNEISSYWDLSDKASTISQKSEYLDKFVAALDSAGLQGSNSSLFFPTPSTSFDQNFIALKSLQQRLHDIQKMDETSFQYQTAIQQITEQEQGQAEDMLSVFSDCWLRVNHPILWNPVLGIIGIIVLPLAAIFGFAMLTME